MRNGSGHCVGRLASAGLNARQRVALLLPSAIGSLAYGSAALGQATLEVRVIECTGQRIVSQADPTLDVAIQMRVTGTTTFPSILPAALGDFGGHLVILGEPDANGALGRDRIMSSDWSGTYYAGLPQPISTVGQGGMAAQFSFLAGVHPAFNGTINATAGQYTNTAENQEILAIAGAAMGAPLLATPGVDADADGHPDTWAGNGGGGSPAPNAVASLSHAIGAAYFAQGQFIDVYRARYTVTNFASARILPISFNVSGRPQVFGQFLWNEGLWKADTRLSTPVVVVPTALDVPVIPYAGLFGDLDQSFGVDCADAIAAASSWGHAYPHLAYRVELDHDLNGANDAADKAAFDAVCSCTQTAPTCGPGWIGGFIPPDTNTAVGAVVTWDPDGADTNSQPARLVAAFDNGGTSAIAQWDGGGWTTMASGISGTVDALGLDVDGKLVAAGQFTSIGGTSANNIARWTGSAWQAIGSGTNGRIRCLSLSPVDGYLTVGGDFAQAGGNTVNHLAMWDGSAWVGIGSGTLGTNGPVYAVGTDPNGYLAVGGSFTEAGGTSIGRGIAAWDGSSWSSMGAGIADNSVLCLATLSTGDLVAGGSFTSADGVSDTSRIAKWDGSSWSALGGGFDETVSTLWRLTGGKLIAGGSFASTGTLSVNRIARWTGSTWTSLKGGLAGTSSRVLGLTAIPSGEIVAGGVFSIAGDYTTQNLGRWSDAGKPWLDPNIYADYSSGNATITATIAPGYDSAGALIYEWKHGAAVVNNGAGGASSGGGMVSGATTIALTITGVQPSDYGAYTVKVTNPCGNVVSKVSTLGSTCAADHNLSGALSAQDIFDFLNDWFAGCTAPALVPPPCYKSADFSGGGLSVQDIFDFLGAWFAATGC